MLVMLLTIVFMLFLMFFGGEFNLNAYTSSGLALIATAMACMCLAIVF